MTPSDVAWPWTDLGGYLDELERRPLPLNVGALQPHGPLRLWAHGSGAGGPGPEGLAAMRGGVREAMEAGAFGLSTGLDSSFSSGSAVGGSSVGSGAVVLASISAAG